MQRNFTIVTLFVLGFLMGCDVGGAYAFLANAVTRNPITIRITSFLAENGPSPLYELEQDMLAFVPLSVIAIGTGLLASFTLRRDQAILGVLFWLGYAIGFSCVLGYYWTTQFGHRGAISLIPSVIGTFCALPAFGIGIHIAAFVKTARIPTYRLADLITLTAACGILAFAAVARSDWISSTSFVILAGALYYRLKIGSSEGGEPSVATEAAS
ncbi:hypothetical protein LOC72_13955 [Roseiconus lacunae]|nr:hypothetical protein [Roseiconus lacunae]